jgi:hypothetical protein
VPLLQMHDALECFESDGLAQRGFDPSEHRQHDRNGLSGGLAGEPGGERHAGFALMENSHFASELRPLFRAAIENCGVGAIPIDEINGAVDLSSKCEIPDQRSVRKLTQRMGLDAIALWLRRAVQG